MLHNNKNSNSNHSRNNNNNNNNEMFMSLLIATFQHVALFRTTVPPGLKIVWLCFCQ